VISDASMLRIAAVLLIIMAAAIALLLLTGERPIDWADLHDVNYDDDAEVTR
jgi:hypothetical protein